MKKTKGILAFGTLFLALSAVAAYQVSTNENETVVNAAADDAATYWDSLSATDGSVYGNTFRAALQTIMVSKGSSTGTNSYQALNTILALSDTNGTSGVKAFYRDNSVTTSWNKEHCWPNSRGAGENAGYAGTDPQVIRPTNTSDNSSRSNYMYAEVANPTSASYSQSTGWDPAAFGFEGARGESARIILYAATRYYNKSLSGAGGSYKGSATSMELTNNLNDATTSGTMGKLSDLLKWNDEYPVTDTEKYRNNYLSGAIGGSSYDYCRNPFIDHPEWANYIWDSDGIRTSAYTSTTASVSIASSSLSIDKGSTSTVQATANNFGTVTWSIKSSSDSTVATATVNSSGLVTVSGLKGGTATIVVQATDGTNTKTASVVVTVVSSDPTVTLSDATLKIKNGASGTVTATATNFTSTPTFTVTGQGSVVTTSVSGTTITVSGASVGTATLTVTGTYGSQTSSASLAVTVTDPNAYTGTYHLVTDVSELSAGSKYAIGSAGAAGSAQFISTSIKSTYYQDIAANTVNDDLSVTPSSTTELFTLGGSSGAWTFTTSVRTSNDGLLCVSGTYNNLTTVASPTSTDYSTWAASIARTGAAVLSNTANGTTKYMEYYSDKGEFTSYTTSSEVYLYVQNTTKTVTSLAVDNQPTKTAYVQGDTLDTAGLKIKATYSDSTTADVTASCTFSPTTLSTVTDLQTITATYGGKTVTFSVSVSAPATLDSIAITTAATSLVFDQNDTLDTAGLVVTGTYSDGSSKDVTSSCAFSPTTLSTVGEQTITVTCLTKTTSYVVTVSAVATSVSLISVSTMPTKTSYTVGDSLDTTGAVITAEYNNIDSADVTSSCSFSPTTLSTAGTQAITASYTYSGKTVTTAFNVAVSSAGGGSGEYTLVADASDLVAGSSIIIAAANAAYAMSATQAGSNRSAIAITKDGSTLTTATGVAEFTLGAGTTSGTYSFYDSTAANTGYIYASSDTSNQMKTETTLSANSSWTITVSSGVASVVANGTNSHNTLQYNSNQSTNLLFSCYTSASQGEVAIYQKAGSTKTATSIEVTTPPTKTSYYVGDTFVSTGLVVTAHYDDNTSAAVTAYTLSTPDMTTAAASVAVTVTYTPDTSLTASFKIVVTAGGAGGYTLVTATSQLTSGSKVIIAASNELFAVSTTLNAENRRTRATINKDTSSTASFTSDAGVCEFTLGVVTAGSTYTFHDSTNSGYLATKSSGTCSTASSIGGSSTWTVALSGGVASLTAQSGVYPCFYNNSASKWFACYGKSMADTKKDLALYVKTTAGDTSAADASSWAQSFLTTVRNVCTAEQQAASTPATALTDAWSTVSGTYSSLSNAAKTLITAASPVDANIVAARQLYAYVENKYGTTALADFLGLGGFPTGANTSLASLENSEGAAIIVVSSFIAAGALGFYLLKRKKAF